MSCILIATTKKDKKDVKSMDKDIDAILLCNLILY